ncbi:hypothetical protein BDV27DRAFT_27996 [Aspergillus caelatus]|uniref:Uncharacterized protein n=1 Tax=Aspergillus caelatus TaxID=61420 RepID=A0A5N6ZV85_9EURO|nr:uncharacterized protein BDV27DRAFT_27996 [Aspergillus caelatus]KAE8361521.1 hypothetical protein BDV27DRAFT_27996 [Aspergillus caelatus]
MGFGYHQMRQRMLKMMDDAAAKAVMVHQGLIIPHVMHSLKYAGSAVMEQGGICRISPISGRCDRCERAFDWNECIWLFRGVPEIVFGAVTYCESCQLKENTLDSPTTGWRLTFTNKVATEDMDRWTCMSQECKSGSNVLSYDDTQLTCPDGSSRRCLPCILSEEGRKCPQCSKWIGPVDDHSSFALFVMRFRPRKVPSLFAKDVWRTEDVPPSVPSVCTMATTICTSIYAGLGGRMPYSGG